MSENENVLTVDMTGIEDKIANAVSKALSGIEERLTDIPTMRAANEVTVPAEIPFDYRKGVAKLMLDDRGGTNASTPIHEGLFSSEEIPSYVRKDEEGNYFITPDSEHLAETIGSFDPDCSIPEIWADDIQLSHVYGKSIFWGAWFMNWNQGIFQKPGDTVHWTRIPPMVAATLACTEPTTTAPTMVCPNCSLTGRVCALYICIDDIEDALTGLVDAVNEAIGNCLSVAIDEYFINIALSCTNLGTLADTGQMTGSLLIEAMGTMQMATYHPVKLVCSSAQYKSLLQDTNFRYANQFGARDVVTGGVLNIAYGVEINETPLGTMVVAGGTHRALLLAKGALAGAAKRGVMMETEYRPSQRVRWLIGSIRFCGVCLHPDGIYWITTVEAS
jgi:hypothetical protein